MMRLFSFVPESLLLSLKVQLSCEGIGSSLLESAWSPSKEQEPWEEG